LAVVIGAIVVVIATESFVAAFSFFAVVIGTFIVVIAFNGFVTAFSLLAVTNMT